MCRLSCGFCALQHLGLLCCRPGLTLSPRGKGIVDRIVAPKGVHVLIPVINVTLHGKGELRVQMELRVLIS